MQSYQEPIQKKKPLGLMIRRTCQFGLVENSRLIRLLF